MQSAAADPGTALELETPLRELFGFSRFLPGQEEIVRRTLAGRDTLALMPTGSGKSLPYQLVAMLLEAPTLVVSPLIALMKDQVDKLPPPVAERTAFVNSSLDPAEASRRLEAFAAGRVKLLYAAPERLRQRSFVSALAAAGVGLVVVDEVHCVSMWGHDFRPDYLFIQTALDRLGSPPVLGLTATATPETEREIGNSLACAFDVVRASVVRPNLHHAVEHVEDEEARRRALLERVGAETGPAIVYARSRKKCEQLSRLLQGHGFEALHYHAGLTSPERTRVQEAFLAGEARIVVATTAFGMGIDKPDIRLVLLYNLPGSLEDYVQMVGRAGRDGAASRCVLFAGQRDAADLRRFARSDLPSAHVLRGVYRTLRAHAQGDVARVDAATIEHGAGLEAGDDPRVLVGILEQSGLVRRGFDHGRVWHVELPEPPADVAARMALLLERMEHGAGLRVEGIVRYAGAHRCRQQLVAEHFGERREEPCGTCDRCLGAEAKAEPAERRALPERPAEAIVAAVDSLRWPLGSTGLAAMLSGSVAAPPSARRSPSFG
ncbi:MAG: ATP-dependent DNA helicase RecQ, partial [Actinobacteria bacterium]|nr:ATP-dependent DNA helicase RecQ [Actinomycetota bacterium]